MVSAYFGYNIMTIQSQLMSDTLIINPGVCSRTGYASSTHFSVATVATRLTCTVLNNAPVV
jgi:hypothetical protein